MGSILVLLGFATEEQIAQALTTQYGFPYLPLKNYEIDPEIVQLIPRQVAQQYARIAVDKVGNSLTVAMSNPLKSSRGSGSVKPRFFASITTSENFFPSFNELKI